MKILIFFIAAAGGYLIGGVNPAIIISRAMYRVDVRRFGSHNPGFTNFMRIFGNKHAYTVFIIDFLKSALAAALFAWAFLRLWDSWQLGAAYTSIFTLLGHAYPVWYNFMGGKGVSVLFASFWIVDWRAAVVMLVIFLIVIAVTRYMSLSVMIASVFGPITLAAAGTEHPAVLPIMAACVLFLIWRHRENIGRLRHGTESKFSLKSSKNNKKEE